ncbi:exosortase B [Dechloromonas denitrificans]|uniref:exosortase B n=1 Tax=Dechloromonas denitrificans TaxID=281362 RepID=UPI001CF835C5|nr:exosortase B [Dechloromonas denitrificans]UCV05496.1 exosortase B [Dechloromonas denitrificans]UCV09842.1 exosortase B [Dechloromonas denitrificans]
MNTLSKPLPSPFIQWFPVLLGIAMLFLPTFVDLARTVWRNDDQVHGPIVLTVALYLFWSLRHDLLDAPIDPLPTIGWPLLVIGLIIYTLGRSQGLALFEIGSLLVVLPAAIVLMRGSKGLKAVWFPIFFLFFMIPLPGAIVDMLTMPMKIAVSYVTENILYTVGYPISRNGVILYMGQYQLLVADACAGLHTLFSLEAMGLLYLHIIKHESWTRNTALAVLIVPISFTANVIRVITLTLITYYFGDEAGQGFIHGFAGMVLFVSALMLIIATDSLLRFSTQNKGLQP